MKIQITKGLVIAICVLISSCSLEENPPTFISKSNFFKTESDARTATDGIYKSLADGGGFSTYGRWWPAVDIGTDDVASKTNRNNFRDFMTHTLNGSHIWLNDWDQYNNFWEGIARANTVIDNIGDIEMEEVLKQQMLGEARALRALFYFHLVRAYGDVPMIVKEIESKDDIVLPRTDVDEIYNNVIIPDLQFAEENCEDALHNGRITKWTAKVILADVYQTRAGWRRTSAGEFVQGDASNWTLARDKAREILMNSPHELITEDFVDGASVVPACGVAWNEKNSFTQESMLELSSVNVEGFGSFLTRECFPNPNGVNFFGAATGDMPFTDEGIDLTIAEMKFPNTPGVGMFIPTPDLWRSFEDGDERRDWGLLTRYTTPNGDTFLLQPTFRKYMDMAFVLGEAGTSFRNTNNNFLVYRYADALLIYAEAANEAGAADALAYSAVNEIRNRAGLADLSSSLSQDDFRKAVWQERRAEFHGECKRRFDLIRTNRLKTETDDIETDWSSEDSDGYGVDFRNSHIAYGVAPWPDHEWLLPIPTSEVNLNQESGWVQNAGYLDE
ncbi:RagB/SusD family nutrient uptake outer membrane protein [Joostella sp.]|uniref:RagB/SusD family nutrient uptake outer membrane protein n=1 Tax=Joostella sp. TaxID=2231138 RepID=UPI003A94A2F4